MIELPDVTVWSMVWTEEQKWTTKVQAVLKYCREIMNPAQVILFTTKPGPTLDGIQQIQIPSLNWQSYNIFINRVIPTYIKSGFAMSVHEDGFPIDVSMWSTAFLEYDYIGAPWNDGVVGNGGFSIESRKLMDLKSDMPLTAEDFSVPSDRLICTTRKQWLEDRGIRFAPAELALKFSTEQVGNDRPSFGFHGRNVSREKYKRGWSMIRLDPPKLIGGFWRQGNNIVAPPRRVAVKPVPAIIPQTVIRPVVIPPKSILPITIPKPKKSYTFPQRINQVVDLKPITVGEAKAAIVYVYLVGGGPKFEIWAKRFVDTYQKYPPGYDHKSIVVLNKGRVTPNIQQLFNPLMDLTFLIHDNSGYDIGAFQFAARQNPQIDVMGFFGSSTYFRGKNWMLRMVEASVKHGLGIYGVMGNRGDSNVNVWPHIRTTGWWINPELMNAYPKRITAPNQRYEFEHGKSSIGEWVVSQGLKRLVVTWDNEYEWEEWDSFPNGFHRGDQSALLFGDRLTESPYYHIS